MSEYGDYSQKMFNDCEGNSIRMASQYSGDYIDFNPNFNFNLSRVSNPQYRVLYFQEKEEFKDTDCTVNVKQNNGNEVSTIRRLRNIQISKLSAKGYLQCRKGSAYQTMELNTNFKTIFCRLIRNLLQLKLVTKDQKQLFFKYKNESPSFKSLIKFLNSTQNRQSKKKLKQLIEKSWIVQKILQSKIQMKNKLVMVKFLQTLRNAINSENQNQKWKKINI